VGAFDSFSGQLGISNSRLGQQYGGLLSDCETQLGWANGTLAQYQSCLRAKCNDVFSDPKHALLKEGCNFYADWFMAANNPKVTYRETTCPQELIDRYNGTATVPITPPATTTYALTVNREPAAGGTVSSSPGGSSFAAGTTVTVTASPNSGYVFSSWSGTPPGAAASGNTVTFTMPSGAVTLTANFQTSGSGGTNYTLAVNRNPVAGGTVSNIPGGTSFAAGTSVTVTANSNSGYTFSDWTGAPAGASTSGNSITFAMPSSNVTLTANFAEASGDCAPSLPESDRVILTINVSPAGSGGVTRVPNKGCYKVGDVVALTAAPGQGYELERWDGDDINGAAPTQSATMWWHRTVNIYFKSDGSVSVLNGSSRAAAARTRVLLKAGSRSFTAMLPANHGYTSYRLIDLQGREIRSGAIAAGTTDLQFGNLKNGVMFLRLEGKGGAPAVFRATAF
jgi:uncharacterized repeat protein (TIGR02543 family)